ncbi:MAG: hypothetical protein RBS55_11250, partial [Bacteroidales bacterium]|nr:hypothetical protein [Bacteroidales bacterium]
SPTTEAVGSNPHKTFGTNGFSRWSTNCFQAIKSKYQTFETASSNYAIYPEPMGLPVGLP